MRKSMSPQSNSSNKIREYRIAAGLQQKALAEMAGVGSRTIFRYEQAEFQGMIPAESKERIAAALGKSVEIIFPDPEGTSINRRQFMTGGIIGAGMLGLGSALGTPFLPNLFTATSRTNFKTFNEENIQTLGDGNYGAWELFDSIQVNSQIEYVQAVAQGHAFTLMQLTQMNLLPAQKTIVLNLLGDIYLLLGRVNQETQNYGVAEGYYNEASAIAHETGNADLQAAHRQRYGFMLVDQERYNAAFSQGLAAMEETKKASYPLWAEARYLAAEAYVRTGDAKTARMLIDETRRTTSGSTPQFWFGKLRATPSAPIIREVTVDILTDRNREAIEVSEKCVNQVKKDEPDNIRWLTRVQILYATALWQFGAIDTAAEVAMECISNARKVGSIINETRIEKLYRRMQDSKYRKLPAVQAVGESLRIPIN